ncbi:MAG: three-helix bundle dimerization domain-containing protein [Acidimicrobiia bacterium]
MEQDLDRQLAMVRQGLIDRYADRFPAASVAEALDRAVRPLLDAPVREYVAVLAERAARRLLEAGDPAGVATVAA